MLTDFNIPCKVKIISVVNCPRTYSTHYEVLGEIGTVVKIHKNKLAGIEIPRAKNNCASGLFWLPLENLKIMEDKTMNIKTFGKDAKFAIVTNPAKPKEVGTVCVYYGELKQGDLVVCDYNYGNSALSARYVERSDVDLNTIGMVDGAILGVCDTTKYFEYKNKMRRREELKKEMIEQAKKYQEEEYWRLLGETNPAMKALYDEFKALEV